MTTLSDIIEKYILNTIQESNKGEILLKRTDLSGKFSCVPSQINYVINTRFTIERGYIVESKRGEGGYLKIVRIPVTETKIYLNKIQEETKSTITAEGARGFLNRLEEEKIISKREKNMIWQLLKDESLPNDKDNKGYYRLKMLKNLIAYLIKEEEQK